MHVVIFMTIAYGVNTNDTGSLKYLFNKIYTAYRNETYTIGWRTQFCVGCGISDVTPVMATRNTTVVMAVK
jgi:hypothetical protein